MVYAEPRKVESKWFTKFESGLPDLTGKVVAITGCTTGTGFVCALTCARKGAHLVMLNRKSSRSSDAERRIKDAAPGATVETIECDLMSFASTRAAAASLTHKFSVNGIDVLCCNAGVMALEDVATTDGFDVQIQTNHLSHFLLTKETFPLLEKAASLRGEARIVNHSSVARHMTRAGLEKQYFGPNGGHLGGNSSSMLCGGARWARYSQTKLANSVWTQALHARLAASGSKVKAVCAAPGLAATNLQVTTNQNGGMKETWIMRFAQSAEDGTMPLLQCCIGSGVASGAFVEPSGAGNMWGPPTEVKLTKKENDPATMEMLWAASEIACGEWKL